MTNYMRSNLAAAAQDIYQKIYDSYYRIAALFGVFSTAFGSLLGLMSEIFNVLLYTYYSFESLYNGPIGGVARFFCFGGDTIIQLSTGESKQIKNIKIGDILSDGSIVTGTLFFRKESDSGQDPIYRYINRDSNQLQDIYVTGHHPVYENGERILVKDSKNFTVDHHFSTDYVYCLNTNTNKIVIDGICFSDFSESSDMKLYQKVNSMMLSKVGMDLGRGQDQGQDPDQERDYYQWGVFDDIWPRDCHDDLIGDIKVSAKGVKLYRYRGIIFSGTQIIKDTDGLWKECRDCMGSVYVRRASDKETLQQWQSKTGEVLLNKNGLQTVIKDYEPIHLSEMFNELLYMSVNV
jgi:hypothetical protein